MIEVELEWVVHGGAVVGRFDGKVIFVMDGLSGERVVIEITEKGSRFDRERVIRVLEVSPGRVELLCPIAGECGGCDWQHTSPEFQFDLKTAVVAEQLFRSVGITRPGRVEAIQPMVNWCTRMRCLVSGGRVGSRGRRSHGVVPLPETGRPAAASGPFPTQLNELVERAELLSAVRATNRVSVLADRELLVGPSRVREKTGKFSSQVVVSGFWQIHPRAVETLLDAVVEGLKPRQGGPALDLYCGSGLFAAGLDHFRAEVFGVELNREAAVSARVSVPRGRFLALSLAKALRRFPSGVDLVVLDPPRWGARAAVVARVADLAPRVVAYVACDPANLVRDLASFAARGYEADRIRIFDLSPMTHHVECVAILKSATRA